MANKTAPTEDGLSSRKSIGDLTRFEPWKVIATAVAAPAVLFGVLGWMVGFIIARAL
jgi:hypothetical protein